jgi:hypothetical protein
MSATPTGRVWGPMIPELADALDGVSTIEGTTVNAWLPMAERLGAQ